MKTLYLTLFLVAMSKAATITNYDHVRFPRQTDKDIDAMLNILERNPDLLDNLEDADSIDQLISQVSNQPTNSLTQGEQASYGNSLRDVSLNEISLNSENPFGLRNISITTDLTLKPKSTYLTGAIQILEMLESFLSLKTSVVSVLNNLVTNNMDKIRALLSFILTGMETFQNFALKFVVFLKNALIHISNSLVTGPSPDTGVAGNIFGLLANILVPATSSPELVYSNLN